jgi:hypothetical protein
MDSVENVLGNKWVLFAGVALGAFILYGKMSAGVAASGNGYVYNPGFQLDGNATALMQTQAQYAYQLGAATISADASKTAGYFATVQALDANATKLASDNAHSLMAVDTAALSNAAAVTIDRQQNDARTSQAYLSANVALHGQDVALAQMRAQTAADVAKASITTMGALATAQGANNTAVTLAGISRGQSVDLATINATRDLGISANDVTKAHIAAGSAFDIASLNGSTAVQLANIGAGQAVQVAGLNDNAAIRIAGISKDAALGVAQYQYKATAKKSDNGLFGQIIGAAASIAPFLLAL